MVQGNPLNPKKHGQHHCLGVRPDSCIRPISIKSLTA